MTGIEHILNANVDDNMRIKIIRNIVEDDPDQLLHNFSSFKYMIKSSFFWDNTPETYSFWEKFWSELE